MQVYKLEATATEGQIDQTEKEVLKTLYPIYKEEKDMLIGTKESLFQYFDQSQNDIGTIAHLLDTSVDKALEKTKAALAKEGYREFDFGFETPRISYQVFFGNNKGVDGPQGPYEKQEVTIVLVVK